MLTFLVTLALVLCLTQAMPIREEQFNTTLSITRSTVHTRMQKWVDQKVPYSQQAYFEGYRTDCSGYVSYGWNSGAPGQVTGSMTDICTKIGKADMKMGDAILNPSHHVIMFDKWIDSDAYWAYQEQQTGTVAMYYKSSWSKVTGEGYFGCRYKGIQEG